MGTTNHSTATPERRSIFVTGAASGIGRATARLFAERGWWVGAHDVDRARLDELIEAIGGRAGYARPLDVTDKADYERAVAEFGEHTGGTMDLLFNNAGIGEGGFFEDVPYAATRRVIDVNFIGVVNGILSALPLLAATPGSLCFSTSSSAATYGTPRLAIYAATKFAVKGLTEALSIEFERLGVRVADVLPGIIDTPILDTQMSGQIEGEPHRSIRDAATPDGAFRLLQPKAVAECVFEAYGSDSDRLHWYVPEEVGEIDRAKAAGAEGVRALIRQAVMAGAAES